MKNSLVLLSLLLVSTFVVSLLLGSYTISLKDLSDLYMFYFYDYPVENLERTMLIQSIIFDIRLPRLLAAILIGASYAVAGASFQSMFINPLVSPGILGVLSGSAFGAALSISFFDSWILTQLFAFSFGTLAVLFAIFVTKIYRDRTNHTLVLILGGIISGSFFSTLLSIVKYTADPYDKLPSIVYWLMGSLASVELSSIYVYSIPLLLGIFSLILMSKYLNILSFGEDEARSLGVNTKLLRFIVIFFATLISALSVSIGGMIGWIGLIIPHFARLIVGPNNIVLLPTVAFMGAIFLMIVDNFSRMLLEVEIPIGILTSLIGIPIFVLALKSSKKGIS
ncbi:MAG: iron complex transport system permease protein [Sulfurimonas sp.]|jgi:iron complex transport system permease protein